MTRDHFYGSWDDEEGSENVIIDASINIKVNQGEAWRKGTFDEISSIKFYDFLRALILMDIGKKESLYHD